MYPEQKAKNAAANIEGMVISYDVTSISTNFVACIQHFSARRRHTAHSGAINQSINAPTSGEIRHFAAKATGTCIEENVQQFHEVLGIVGVEAKVAKKRRRGGGRVPRCWGSFAQRELPRGSSDNRS